MKIIIGIIIGCSILGFSYYSVQIEKQESIERQQYRKINFEKTKEINKQEQEKKEYIAERRKDCYEIEKDQSKRFNNINDGFYDEDSDGCIIRYKAPYNHYKDVDCDVSYKGSWLIDYKLDCKSNLFRKKF